MQNMKLKKQGLFERIVKHLNQHTLNIIKNSEE